MATTIQIDERTKLLLDKLKVHYRQSYNELIETMAKEKANQKKGNVLRETFGTAKFKKSTKQMMKETDEELYDI